jgi:hypothetical protein
MSCRAYISHSPSNIGFVLSHVDVSAGPFHSPRSSKLLHLNDSMMTFEQQRRERSSSDRAQPAPFPQRPGLPGRTISAPAGGLYKLDSSRMATDTRSKVESPLIEEEEHVLSRSDTGLLPIRDGNGVSSVHGHCDLTELGVNG